MDIKSILELGSYLDKNNLGLSVFTINLNVPIFKKQLKVEAFNLVDLSINP